MMKLSNTLKHFELGCLLGIPIGIWAIIVNHFLGVIFALGIVLGWEACQFASQVHSAKELIVWLKTRLFDSIVDVMAGMGGVILIAGIIYHLWLLIF